MQISDTMLVLGNKNYSSWSLRGWLVARMAGLNFQEIVIPLRRPETKEAIRRWSPSGKVPCLQHGSIHVWDSLALAEYLHELDPAARLWPEETRDRASARAIVAEMHSGFPALRGELPMDLCRHHSLVPSSAAQADIDRVRQLLITCRETCRESGAFLFGNPGIADAFYAPVISRFVTYDVFLPPLLADYAATIQAWDLFQEWREAAAQEPWVIADISGAVPIAIR